MAHWLSGRKSGRVPTTRFLQRLLCNTCSTSCGSIRRIPAVQWKIQVFLPNKLFSPKIRCQIAILGCSAKLVRGSGMGYNSGDWVNPTEGYECVTS